MKHRHHHGSRPIPTTTLQVRVEEVRDRGVRVRLVGDRRGDLFWLPRGFPCDWEAPPEVDQAITVRLPRWLATKHRPVVAFRVGGQASLSFNPPPTLGPEASKEGSFPMTDHSNERRGVLFRETEKKSDRAPDMTGHLTLGGVRYRLAGWTKEGRDGRKYLSLAAEPPREQNQQPEATNSYAAAHGRPQPQQAERPSFEQRLEDEIPF